MSDLARWRLELTTMLVQNMLHLYGLSGEKSSIELVSLRSMLLQTYGDVCTKDLLLGCAEELSIQATNTPNVVGSRLDQLFFQVEDARRSDSALSDHLVRVYQTTEILLGLLTAKYTPGISQYKATITSPDLFRFIESWNTTPEGVTLTLMLSHIESSMRLSFGEKLPDVKVRYRAKGLPPDPQLTVINRRTHSALDGTLLNRPDWEQKPFRDYDLNFSSDGRITTVIEQPQRLYLGGGIIVIAPGSGIGLLSTSIFKSGTLLARTSRVIHIIAGSSAEESPNYLSI